MSEAPCIRPTRLYPRRCRGRKRGAARLRARYRRKGRRQMALAVGPLTMQTNAACCTTALRAPAFGGECLNQFNICGHRDLCFGLPATGFAQPHTGAETSSARSPRSNARTSKTLLRIHHRRRGPLHRCAKCVKACLASATPRSEPCKSGETSASTATSARSRSWACPSDSFSKVPASTPYIHSRPAISTRPVPRHRQRQTTANNLGAKRKSPLKPALIAAVMLLPALAGGAAEMCFPARFPNGP